MDGTSEPINDLSVATNAALSHLASTWVSPAQAERVARILQRFTQFCAKGFGVRALDGVTPQMAAAFIDAPEHPGTVPSLPLRHLRRTSLRLLFRSGRSIGTCSGDPTLDLRLPPRDQVGTRPLTDVEVTLCRATSSWSLNDRRRGAAWALAEATCRSVEIGQVTRGDIDLEAGQLWVHGGRVTADRWASLDDWACCQLEMRLHQLPDDPATLVVYEGDLASDVGQISSCIAVRDVLIRAGLGREPGVRPASVAAWAGRRWVDDGVPVDEVARRLGMSSLDRTARFVGWDWAASRA